jgi:AcrR family transcriptional regulator
MKTGKIEIRRELLEAATALFSRHGFKATSIRMICKAAKVNVEAVYYHFGNKEALYHEALRHALSSAYDKYPLTYGLTVDATPEDRLYAIVRSFLLLIFDEGNPFIGTLIVRQMVETDGPHDGIVEEGFRALFDQLAEIVQVLVGENAGRDLVLACSRNTICQCLFYLCNRSVISRMTPDLKFVPDYIEQISGQITSFTLHALEGMAKDIG